MHCYCPWSLVATHSIRAAVLLQSTPHPNPLPEERELVATKTPPSKPPTPPLRKGGKVGGVWSFFPPCEGGTQGGASNASALCQVRGRPMARVILGVTGSVAAIRTPELFAAIHAQDHLVRVV